MSTNKTNAHDEKCERLEVDVYEVVVYSIDDVIACAKQEEESKSKLGVVEPGTKKMED